MRWEILNYFVFQILIKLINNSCSKSKAENGCMKKNSLNPNSEFVPSNFAYLSSLEICEVSGQTTNIPKKTEFEQKNTLDFWFRHFSCNMVPNGSKHASSESGHPEGLTLSRWLTRRKVIAFHSDPCLIFFIWIPETVVLKYLRKPKKTSNESLRDAKWLVKYIPQNLLKNQRKGASSNQRPNDVLLKCLSSTPQCALLWLCSRNILNTKKI